MSTAAALIYMAEENQAQRLKLETILGWSVDRTAAQLVRGEDMQPWLVEARQRTPNEICLVFSSFSPRTM